MQDANDDLRVVAVLDALAETEQRGLLAVISRDHANQRLGDAVHHGENRVDDGGLQRLRTLLQ